MGNAPMVEMTKAEAVERYGERVPKSAHVCFGGSMTLGVLLLDGLGDDVRICFPDPDYGVEKSPASIKWPRLNISPEDEFEPRVSGDERAEAPQWRLSRGTASDHGTRLPVTWMGVGKPMLDPDGNPSIGYQWSSSDAITRIRPQDENPLFGHVHIPSGDPESDEVNRKANAAIAALEASNLPEGRLYSMRNKQPETPRHIVTMEAWQAAALFGEAMVGVEVQKTGERSDDSPCGPVVITGVGGVVLRTARGRFYPTDTITFPLPRVRYVPTEEQPNEPSVGGGLGE